MADAHQKSYMELTSIIRKLTYTIASILLFELNRAIAAPELTGYDDDKVEQYLVVIGYLALAGRELSEQNIREIIKVQGKVVDEPLLRALISLHFRSHLFYLYTLIVMEHSGIELDVNNLAKWAGALGIEADPIAAGEALMIYNKVSSEVS